MDVSILVIEDSPQVHTAVSAALEGYCTPHFALTLAEAREALASKPYDVALVDVKLPDGNGLDFFRTSQPALFSNVGGVVFLTGIESTDEKVTAFEHGACDYITKPFDPRELRARLRALVQRLPHRSSQGTGPTSSFAHGIPGGEATTTPVAQGLRFDTTTQRVAWYGDGREHIIPLTSLEFRILRYLATCSPEPASREAILTAVWGEGVHVAPRVIDTHLSHARAKIAPSGYTILNKKGQGYLLAIAEGHDLAPLIDEALVSAWLSDLATSEAFKVLFRGLQSEVPAMLEPLDVYAHNPTAQNREHAFDALHKLKSSVGQVGAARLAMRVREGEHALGTAQAASHARLMRGTLLALWKETERRLHGLLQPSP